MRRFFARCANLFRRRRAEREMTREIESHLALIAEDFERAGMSPDEAARAARRAYGGVEQSKELHRDARTFVWVEQLLRDIRYAWRNLLRAPGFTLVAAIALALGLGVNVAIFAVYDATMMKPLPLADPDRVVRLKRWFQRYREDDQFRFSYAEYQYLRDHASAFSGLVASYGDGEEGVAAQASIDGSAPETMPGRAVSPNYFAALGETPSVGRFFRPEEDQTAGADPVIALTWRFWQRRFGGDRSVIGKSVMLNGLPYTVIGVAREKFTGTGLDPLEFDYWAPLSMVRQLDPASKNSDPSGRTYQVLGRLKNGVSLEQAQAEASLLLRQYLSAGHEPDKTTGLTLERTRYLDLSDPDDGPGFEAAAAAMWIVVWLILGSACANVANMLLARGASRQREIGIRLAMGASRGRIIRQLLLESVLLSVLGGIAAIPLSVIAGRALWLSLNVVFRTAGLSLRQPDIRPDGHLLAYGMTVSIVTGILFGLAPALRLTRLDLNRAMKEEGSIFGARFRRSHLRGALLGSQAAVSLLLLLVSGAVMTKARDAAVSNLGFDTHNAYVLYTQGQEQGRVDLGALRGRLANLPEIAGTAIGDSPSGDDDATLPMNAGKWNSRTFASTVSDGYFDVMGMRIERGRAFTRQEIASHDAVTVITESTARRCWPNENPLGKLVSLTIPEAKAKNHKADFEVIGAVNDVRQADMIRIDPVRVYILGGGQPAQDLILRIRGNRGKALAAVQAAIESFDPKLLPGLTLRSIEEGNIAALRTFYRVMAGVAGVLSLLAITLAVVGIYGVTAFLVGQRTREIGIRAALGATSRMLLKGFVLDGLRPVVIGMVFGFAAALSLDAWYRSTDLAPETMLHRVFGSPTVCAEVALMLGVVALASLIPARRALRVDPMKALRHE